MDGADHANNHVPRSVLPFLRPEELSDPKILSVLACTKCKEVAERGNAVNNIDPGGKCLILFCKNRRRNGCQHWFLCRVCKKRVDKRRVKLHFTIDKKHKALVDQEMNMEVEQEELEPQPEPMQLEPLPPLEATHHDSEDENKNEFAILNDDMSISENDSIPEGDQEVAGSIERAFKDVPLATIQAIHDSFGDQTNMKLFFVAERVHPFGGIQYLVSRAFQKTEHLVGSVKDGSVANVREAKFHFQNFIKYTRMKNEQDRQRDAYLTSTLAAEMKDGGFLQATRVLDHKELNRHYGKSNKHTIWNCLPIPTVENFDGIAYISPVNLIRFLAAFGKDFDDIIVKFGGGIDEPTRVGPAEDEPVFHICQSKTTKDWSNALVAKYPEGLGKCRDGLNDYLNALLLWMVDWKDGFGANRTKNNRKVNDLWTAAFGTPKWRVNSIDNTPPCAIGLKTNKSWWNVKRKFREDIMQLSNGLDPLYVCHGGLKKVIPVFVRRVACLADKPERADYTSTLSHTSIMHRYFGYNIGWHRPLFDAERIMQFVDNQANGNQDESLRAYGWSHSFVQSTNNGSVFASCYKCRKRNVDFLRVMGTRSSGNAPVSENVHCEKCADWKLDSTTKDMLTFKSSPKCPAKELPGCPVSPPVGREVGREWLHYITLTFDVMIQGARCAFFNCYGRKSTAWSKENCREYLRCCGINRYCQDYLFNSAREAFQNEVQVDYTSVERLGGFLFPSTWASDISLERFIEMAMHLLFLGVAERNLNLCNLHLKFAKSMSPLAFKKRVQDLLKALTIFNLSWLLILPFSGPSSNLTTGTWVSENWLAWVRISKVAYLCLAFSTEFERKGANDVIRLVACFTAVVAQVLSHAGVTKERIELVDRLVKEFLSTVRELDARVRHKMMNSAAKKNSKPESANAATESAAATESTPANKSANQSTSKSKKKNADNNPDQWWLKTNYISLLNLARAMRLLGPLINFWDGGGKGERYIQEVRPHVPRGIRDGGEFFVKLLEKVLKMLAVGIIEEDIINEIVNDINVDNNQPSDNADCQSAGDDSTVVDEVIDATIPVKAALYTTDGDDDVDDDDDQSTVTGEEEEEAVEKPKATEQEEEQWLSPMEDQQMSKARAIYIYKTEDALRVAEDDKLPIAAVVLKNEEEVAEAYAVFRTRDDPDGNSFGWLKLSFQDDQGKHMCGLFYSPLSLVPATNPPPQTFQKIQQLARMSAVAIPLKCPLGLENDHPDSFKCCVITNWWRERNEKGVYRLPTLDFERYKESQSSD